jgi:hypothetical protein
MSTPVRYRTLLSAAKTVGARHAWSFARGSEAALRESITRSIEVALLPEMACMARFMGRTQHSKSLTAIRCRFKTLLDAIEDLIVKGEIEPWHGLRLSENDPPTLSCPRPLRLGVYPIRANPIHWGHLLSGLGAIASARLDKVVYVVVDGDTDNGELLPEGLRHNAAHDLLKSFEPLLCYSPVGRGLWLDKESSIFHVLALNEGRKIDAFYIGEGGQCRRKDPVTGEPGTLEKLENGVLRRIFDVAGHTDGEHSISVVFLKGEERIDSTATFLPIRFIPTPLPEVSPVELRKTLMGERNIDVLAALPFTVFQHTQGAAVMKSGKVGLKDQKVGCD